MAAGFDPNVTFECDDYETVQGLVAPASGVALVPRLALTRVHPGIVVRELSPRSPARKVVAATMSGPGVAPAARTMLRILVRRRRRGLSTWRVNDDSRSETWRSSTIWLARAIRQSWSKTCWHSQGRASGDRALEVGAGTGKATVLFAARGFELVALEPSAEMAAVARRNCAGFENVTIEQAEFERWSPEGERFRLAFSAQAWHWVSPDIRYSRAREALVRGRDARDLLEPPGLGVEPDPRAGGRRVRARCP